MNILKNCIIFVLILITSVLLHLQANASISTTDNEKIPQFISWIQAHSHSVTGLPYSHVGDTRFQQWTITYDAAVVTLAYLAADQVDDARRIIDYYLDHPQVWRLGGIIEAFIAHETPQGQDWSVRTGANLWMGIAAFHVYKKTKEIRYLQCAQQILDWALTMQNRTSHDPNFGGIALGPKGDIRYEADQHLGYKSQAPSFSEIYPTEIMLDAYALTKMIYLETKIKNYLVALKNMRSWLKTNAYNPAQKRLNRGYHDTTIASDVHSWAVSSLGVEVLDSFSPHFAEDMIHFVQQHCVAKVEGIQGVDFIAKSYAKQLERKPLVSFEWTFQLINAYQILIDYFVARGNTKKQNHYTKKKQVLLNSMMDAAIPCKEGLAYAYASQPDALIGHEYRTPHQGNLSVIGGAWAVLALSQYDPLHTKSIRE